MDSHVAPIYHIADIQMIKFAAFSCIRGSVEIDLVIYIYDTAIHMRYIMV